MPKGVVQVALAAAVREAGKVGAATTPHPLVDGAAGHGHRADGVDMVAAGMAAVTTAVATMAGGGQARRWAWVWAWALGRWHYRMPTHPITRHHQPIMRHRRTTHRHQPIITQPQEARRSPICLRDRLFIDQPGQ